LAIEGLIAGLATWFAIVAVTAVPGLLPQRIRPQLPPEGTAYFDDFGVFYTAGWLLRQGQGDEIYNVTSLADAEHRIFDVPANQLQPLPFFNPPQALLLFAPLSFLKLNVAATLWMAGTLALAVAALLLLLANYRLRLGAGAVCCLILALVSSLPFYQTFVHGQLSFLLFFGVCLLYASMRRPSPGMSVTGLLILSIKPQLLLLPVILFLLQRRYRELAITLIGGLALIAAAVGISGLHTLGNYVRLLVSST
jgi:hypothetical protein